MTVLKVSSRSSPNAVAGAFAAVVREHGRAEVQVVGAGALNQAIKAVAIARTMVAAQGVDLVCVPSFTEIVIDGEARTAMRLVVEGRHEPDPSTELDPQLNVGRTAAATVSDLHVEIDLTADVAATEGRPPALP